MNDDDILNFFNDYNSKNIQHFILQRCQRPNNFDISIGLLLPKSGQILRLQFNRQVLSENSFRHYAIIVRLRSKDVLRFYTHDDGHTYSIGSGLVKDCGHMYDDEYSWLVSVPESVSVMANLAANVEFSANILGMIFEDLHRLYKNVSAIDVYETNHGDQIVDSLALDRAMTLRSIANNFRDIVVFGGYKMKGKG